MHFIIYSAYAQSSCGVKGVGPNGAVAENALAIVLAVFGIASTASAHTANISSSRIVPEPNNHYRVEVGFLGTDIERMFAENKPKRRTSISPSRG